MTVMPAETAVIGKESTPHECTAVLSGASPSYTTRSNGSPSVAEVGNGYDCLSALYAPSAIAKIWGVALRALRKSHPPTSLPEYTLPGDSAYISSDASFWTSGFFPGSLYLLYERQRRWPDKFNGIPQLHPMRLQFACRWWSQNLHAQASLKGTHDLGFLIQPWARLGWILDKSEDCFHSLVTAARGLADRFDSRVGCIRSWDTCVTKRYSFGDPSIDFLVIIDNMMNLDLLYFVADLTNDPSLAEVATTHALTTLTSHIREDYSTYHVVIFSNTTGHIKARMTNQGYSDDSCWARGQAWAITGYAQCYARTKDIRFLDASQKLADYFISRLSEDGVPAWDFDAPEPGPKDTSAAMIAAYGMVLLHELTPGDSRYLATALRLASAVVQTSLSPSARVVQTCNGDEDVDLGGHDTILLHATINNYEYAPRRWADHGLVYADYYFLLMGNKLLELGLM